MILAHSFRRTGSHIMREAWQLVVAGVCGTASHTAVNRVWKAQTRTLKSVTFKVVTLETFPTAKSKPNSTAAVGSTGSESSGYPTICETDEPSLSIICRRGRDYGRTRTWSGLAYGYNFRWAGLTQKEGPALVKGLASLSMANMVPTGFVLLPIPSALLKAVRLHS